MKVVFTIDVEYYTGDCNREVYGDGLGLEYVLAVLSRHHVRATFFVEALAATRWGLAGLRNICAKLNKAGQDIQLHIHPVTANIPGFKDSDDVLWKHDAAIQEMLIKAGIENLKSCGVSKVSFFRAGDFAADVNTLTAMKRAGIIMGSNRDLDIKWSTRSRLNDAFPARNDLSSYEGVTDLPLSCVRSCLPFLDGKYRHLEICAMSFAEISDCLTQMANKGYVTAAILTHPAEFFRAKGGRYAPIEKNCRRFECLLDFLGDRADMRIVTAGELAGTTEISRLSPPDVRPRLVYSLFRVVEQGVDRVLSR